MCRRGRRIRGEGGDGLAPGEDLPLFPTGAEEIATGRKQKEAGDEDQHERGQHAQGRPHPLKSFICSHFHAHDILRLL